MVVIYVGISNVTKLCKLLYNIVNLEISLRMHNVGHCNSLSMLDTLFSQL